MKLISSIKDKVKRHQERYTPLDYKFVIAESIEFLNAEHWQAVASYGSIFLSHDYLRTIEAHPPKNTEQRYAIAYDSVGQPVLVAACQIAEINGENLKQSNSRIERRLSKRFEERALVCGNLVSSGLHGVAFIDSLAAQQAWRILAEILYKIRRAEQLNGTIDFVMLKDIKESIVDSSRVLERYSYRSIQTDPDMVLTLTPEVKNFEDYLARLTSKYRSRAKKIAKTIEKAGYECKKLVVTKALDEHLVGLYLQVESKSSTRLATLESGYFHTLAQNLGEDFCCYGISKDEKLAGFISVIKDGDVAVAYYVGIDYAVNKTLPIYFRLLQLVINCALDMDCQTISFGRTALEPKANLGAKPVNEYVWARHRVPLVNFFVRKLFRTVTVEEAPERSVTKTD